jgi:hypothetical protein
VLAAFGVPVLTSVAGQYWLNYAWTGFLTVGIALLAALAATAPGGATGTARSFAIAAVALALALGLPLQLPRAYAERGARSYAQVQNFVAQYARANGWVYSAPQAYFALVEKGAIVVTDEYATGRLAPGIPEEQRRRIRLFVVHPNEVEAAMTRLGGSWKELGTLNPQKPSRLVWLEPGDRAEPYRLVAYVRE